MKLFVFAHRAEAHGFLEHSPVTPCHQLPWPEVWRSSLGLIAILGEGGQAGIKLAALLAKFPEVNQVINLGIAGSLREHFETEQFFSIRTVYGESEFHSYTSNDPTSTVDCLSSRNRILTQEDQDQLSHFACLIDRELWHLARACSLFKVPWLSYKLISDQAQQVSCEDIQKQGHEWGEKIFHHYSLGNHLEVSPKSTPSLSNKFYFTFSQQKQFQKFCDQLKIKWQLDDSQILAKLPLQSLEELDILPKRRSQKLLEWMRSQVSPFQTGLVKSFEQWAAPLTQSGHLVTTDPHFEEKQLKVSARLKSQSEIDHFIRQLKKLEFSEFEKIIQGEDHDV